MRLRNLLHTILYCALSTKLRHYIESYIAICFKSVQRGEYAVHCQIYREHHADFSLENIKLIFSMKNVSPPVQ